MKKVIGIIMTLMLVLLMGCGTNTEGKELLDEYLKNVDEYEISTREVGEPASYIHMDEQIAIGILYPEIGIEKLDQAIYAWVEELVEEYKEMMAESELPKVEESLEAEIRAELTVSYESFAVGDSVIGVKLTGTFVSPTLAHPVDIIKTFNVDQETEELLQVADVLAKGGESALVSMLIVQTGIEEDVIDENIFNYSVFMDEGIEIVLKRGDYLPMSAGTKTVFFAYDEISSLLSDDFDYASGKPKDSVKTVEETTEPEAERNIDPDKPMVALTFDDGPSAHTERLLDAFEESGGKGTFFVLGNLIDGREDTLKRTVAEGHEVANHSWNHRQLTNLTEEEVKDQIMMTRAKIFAVTGKDTLVVRAPYGACDDMVLDVGKELGVSFYNWSIDTLDWLTKDPAAIEEEILQNVSDGDIILCHDLHETTVDAMESVIPKLVKKGYQLVTITELMTYSDEKVKAGQLYHQQ